MADSILKGMTGLAVEKIEEVIREKYPEKSEELYKITAELIYVKMLRLFDIPALQIVDCLIRDLNDGIPLREMSERYDLRVPSSILLDSEGGFPQRDNWQENKIRNRR